MINTIKSLALAFAIVTILPSFTTDQGLEIEIKAASSIEGEYEGMLTFSGAKGNVVANPAGSAKIIKSGETYTISFSNDVPSLTGLKFVNEDNSYVTIKSSNSVSGIVIDEGDLSVGVTKDGNTWAFSGKK